MKKISLLFLFLPLFIFSQTTLVKWYQADFSPTSLDNNLVASKITRPGGSLTNTSWGDANVFYSAEDWPNSPAINLSQYIQFTVSPKTGYRLNLSSFVFNARSQWGAGSARMEVRYSKSSDFTSFNKLQEQTSLSANYLTYQLDFPSGTAVNSGEILYIRIYQYNSNSNFHIEHNLSGTVAPHIRGSIVLEQPKKPKAEDDRIGTEKNKPVTASILNNDDYLYSGPLTAITATKPPHGTVTVNGLKDITYTPDSGYVGYDSFHYTLTNAVGLSNTAKVEVQVIEPMSGTPLTLVRWNKSDFRPTNYAAGLEGSRLTATGQTLETSAKSQPPFQVSGLPTPQQFNGSLDESKYISASVTASNPEYTTYLKTLNMTYRGNGGNITVAYSKTADFSGKTEILVNNISYTNEWVNKAFSFPSGTILYPGETLYLRIYTYNTWNVFFIDFVENGPTGPSITGISSLYAPEPCTKTVTWSGSNWSGGQPDINKKAVLNGDYDTSKNGTFESCSLSLNGGKIIVAAGNSLTVYNEITLTPATAIEVRSDANLIQVNDAAPANTGNITVLRDIKIGAGRTQYNYLGSPVTFAAGQSLKTVYPGIDFVLYYNEANNFFYSSSGANIPGRGLAVKEPTKVGVAAGLTNVTAQYKGVPQNGIISFPLANSNTGTSTAFGFNLLGNPYPSNIDLRKLYDLNGGNTRAGKASPNISATFYFWDNGVNGDVAQTQQGSSYSGQAYAVYNVLAGSRGTGTSAAGYLNSNVTGKKIPTEIIKTGQGFMAKALVKDYTLKFSNSIRTSQGTGTDFLGKSSGEEQTEDDRYWLKMISPANLTGTLAVVYFEGGSRSFGQEDSESKGGSDEIYTLADDKKLTINGRDRFSIIDRIPLGSQHFVNGNYTIALEKSEGVFANGQSVYLKDLQTGIITNLSQGSYTYSANAGALTGRFEIVYQPEAVLATDVAATEELVVYRDGSDFVIKAQREKITGLEVYDASGRLMMSLRPNSKRVMISSDQLGHGVYLLKMNQNGQRTTKKIIR